LKNQLKKYLLHIGTDWSNKDDVLTKVSSNGLNLQYADSGLRDDAEIVASAFENNPESIIYASRNIRDDKDTMLKLVSLRPSYVQYVSDRLKKDEDIAYESIPGGEEFIDDEILFDKDFAIMIAENKGHVLYEFEESIDVINASKDYFIERLGWVSSSPPIEIATIFASAHKSLKNDRDYMLKIVKVFGLCIKYGSDEIKADKEVVMAAVKNSATAIQHVSDELKDDDEIVEAAIRCWPNNIRYGSNRIKHSEKFHKIYYESIHISTHKDLGFDEPNAYTEKVIEGEMESAIETLKKILDGTYD